MVGGEIRSDVDIDKTSRRIALVQSHSVGRLDLDNPTTRRIGEMLRNSCYRVCCILGDVRTHIA